MITDEPVYDSPKVDIKTVYDLKSRLTGKANNDFDNEDAFDISQFAMKNKLWQYQIFCGAPVVPYAPDPRERARALVDTRVESSTHMFMYEVSVAICAPNGKIALWHGDSSATTSVSRDGLHPSRVIDRHGAALCALRAKGTNRVDERRAAYYWHRNVNRGGARDARPLAAAACRVVHAHVFAYEPTLRDTLLAHMLDLPSQARPTTKALLTAKEDALAAASAMLLAGMPDAAVACVRRGGA